MPNIVDHEDLYGVIVLQGVTSPGLVTLSGHNRKVNWDVRSGPFANGATGAFKSILPIKFTASFYLLKDIAQGIDDFALWPAFRTLINSTVASPSDPKALDIYHPALAANDIKSVVKAEMGGEIYDRRGGMTVAVKFQEYRPFKKWEGIPKSAPKNDPHADANAALNRVFQQSQRTPFG